MAISIESDDMKKKILTNPNRILDMAKSMDANVERAEKIFDELMNNSLSVKEWFDKLEEMMDLTVMAIIDALQSEFHDQGLGEYDLEKYFLRAMWNLKRCTPESVKRAEEAIDRAKLEAKRLENIKKEALDTTLEIGAMLKDTKGEGEPWSLRNEYLKVEDSVEHILSALDRGNFELAQYLAKNAFEKAKELREMKLTALRYAAKAGHIVAKVKTEEQSTLPKGSFHRLNTFLSTIKYLLEEGDYQTAMILAKGVKHEAEILLPPERTGTVVYVCPICFDTKCPNSHCNMSISPSPLIHETCRTYCLCGTYYHICCVQKAEELVCVNCHKPLKG
ncbi:MAG: hypothetical protein JSV56_00220 [Methanomassiliicoccales archaeon]|nr:MAG: hypothetical protein JSV56_00220 [Methanomassiliicoccales archaeon]